MDWIVKNKTPLPEQKARPHPERKPKHGQFIYMIRCGQYIKIGIALRPKQRMRDLQVASPHKLILVHAWLTYHAKRDERRLHHSLKQYHIRGEWFELPDEIVCNLMSCNS